MEELVMPSRSVAGASGRMVEPFVKMGLRRARWFSVSCL